MTKPCHYAPVRLDNRLWTIARIRPGAKPEHFHLRFKARKSAQLFIDIYGKALNAYQGETPNQEPRT